MTEPTVPTAVDRLIAKIDSTDFASLANSDPQLKVFLDYATRLFDNFHPGVQGYGTALMMGMLWASIEGEMVHFEKDENELIGVDDRMKIWMAVARVAFREALAARMTEHPDNPDDPGKGFLQ